MSDVDWSVAPGWANYIVRDKRDPSLGLAWVDELEDDGKIQWHNSLSIGELNAPRRLDVVGSRPKIKPFKKPEEYKQEWNGEGLPPIGGEVELRYPQGQWLKVAVLYYDDVIALIKRTTGTNEYRIINHINSAEFRPIRTEEEKAIEHLALILAKDHEDVTGLVKDHRMFVSVAKSIYKAGYRKQEAAE